MLAIFILLFPLLVDLGYPGPDAADLATLRTRRMFQQIEASNLRAKEMDKKIAENDAAMNKLLKELGRPAIVPTHLRPKPTEQELQTALDFLEKHGYIRIIPVKPSEGKPPK